MRILAGNNRLDLASYKTRSLADLVNDIRLYRYVVLVGTADEVAYVANALMVCVHSDPPWEPAGGPSHYSGMMPGGVMQAMRRGWR